MDLSVRSAICHTEKPWNNLFCGLERNVSWLCRILMLLGRNLYWWSPRQHHTIQSHQAVWIPDSAAFGPSLLLPTLNGKKARLPSHLLFCCHGEFWDKGANANRDLSFYRGAVGPRVASQCVSWTYEDEVCLLSAERKESSRNQWNQVLGPQVKAILHLLHRISHQGSFILPFEDLCGLLLCSMASL